MSSYAFCSFLFNVFNDPSLNVFNASAHSDRMFFDSGQLKIAGRNIKMLRILSDFLSVPQESLRRPRARRRNAPVYSEWAPDRSKIGKLHPAPSGQAWANSSSSEVVAALVVLAAVVAGTPSTARAVHANRNTHGSIRAETKPGAQSIAPSANGSS